MEYLIIDVGKQLDGFTFRLNPGSRIKLEERFPGTRPVSSVFVSYDTYEEKDFGMLPESVWKYVALMLTGFSDSRFEKSGDGFVFFDPLNNKEIFKTRHGNV
ncbi:hypothetical protein QUF80_22865 [Desulfococcaceae bacterium HSG8]|nr:hypothetical protein [Desulfococcaceae bacterium HSG8]